MRVSRASIFGVALLAVVTLAGCSSGSSNSPQDCTGGGGSNRYVDDAPDCTPEDIDVPDIGNDYGDPAEEADRAQQEQEQDDLQRAIDEASQEAYDQGVEDQKAQDELDGTSTGDDFDTSP